MQQSLTCVQFDLDPAQAASLNPPTMHALTLALLIALTGPQAEMERGPLPGERLGADSLVADSVLANSVLADGVLAESAGRVAITNSAPGLIPSLALLPAGVSGRPRVAAESDTVPRRRRSVEVSEWYERRLRLHRYGAYTVIPLFTFQAIAGNQVYQKGDGAPGWARTGHRAGAGALAAVFTLNTVTGLWNLWEARAVEQGRTRRTVHALLMLASDAGFTYAGARLSEQAETDASKRDLHRKFAYASMATALTGAGVMVFGRD